MVRGTTGMNARKKGARQGTKQALVNAISAVYHHVFKIENTAAGEIAPIVRPVAPMTTGARGDTPATGRSCRQGGLVMDNLAQILFKLHAPDIAVSQAYCKGH